ncbi:MAG: DUF6263 family protein [Bacteroidota bacterium]
MKRSIVLVFAVMFLGKSFAQQQTQKIVLDKNQQLNFISTVKGNMDQEYMGMSIDMDLNVSSDKNISVKEKKSENYLIDYTTKHLKMDVVLADQRTTFDSDNKNDMKSEMNDLARDINVAKKYSLDHKGQSIALDTINKTTTKEATPNPMSGLLDQMISNETEQGTLESYFMLLNSDKKIGSTWQDSIVNSNNKRHTSFKWDSTINNIAIIKITQKINNKIKSEMMGLEVEMDITNDVQETRQVNLSSGIIERKTSINKMSGTADVMGISMPITGTVTNTVELKQ